MYFIYQFIEINRQVSQQNLGSGLLHVRKRVSMPPPHVTVQGRVSTDQAVHLPCTTAFRALPAESTAPFRALPAASTAPFGTTESTAPARSLAAGALTAGTLAAGTLAAGTLAAGTLAAGAPEFCRRLPTVSAAFASVSPPFLGGEKACRINIV